MAKKIDKAVDDKRAKVEIITAGQPAHEAAISMLATDPWSYAVTLTTMYGEEETIIPLKRIPALIRAFKQAKKRIIERIDRAIFTLEEQAKETKKRKKRKYKY